MTRGQLILDRYEPLGTAGAGGFGTVQIAWDPRIQRKVAIKTIELSEADAQRAALPGAEAVNKSRMNGDLHDRWHGIQPWNEYLAGEGVEPFPEQAAPPAPSSPRAYEQVPRPAHEPVAHLAHLPGLDEARTAAKLQDQRIVTVFDFEVRDQVAYLIMEYVEGITLTRLLAQHGDRLTLDMVAAVFDAVAGALSVAHAAGVLHLDIKPDNILINAQGQAKVTDFGLATLADATGTGTTGGGTIGYMPLEQMRREPLDARTDEWSLASVLYEMLTGDNPFRAHTLDEAEHAIEDAELVLPSLCWDYIDDQIDDVVFYALDPDPEQRYESVADFAEEVDKFLGDAKAGTAQLAALVDSGEGGEEADFEDEEDVDDDLLAEPRVSALARLNAWEPSERLVGLAGRAFAAIGSAFVALLAFTNVPLFAFLGDNAVLGSAVAAVAVGVLGAFLPHAGALASFALLGFAIIAAGHPLPGVVLIAAAAAWWYAVGRRGMAETNVALLLPLAGAIGGSSALPLVAGAALRPASAIATSAFAAVAAGVLASLGSGTLLDWNALAHWSFGSVDITGNLISLVTAPDTWATVVGWIAAAAALSVLTLRESRLLRLAGLAVAVAAVAVGSIIFAAPTPQLIVPLVIAAAVVLVF